MTDNIAKQPAAGWVFYDSECDFCIGWMRRMERALIRRGFVLAPLQARERRRPAGEVLPKTETRQRDAGAPGKIPAPVFTEMILELPDGRELGGADAVIFLAQHVWWLWPLWLFSQVPGAMPIFRTVYRRIAAKRHCAAGACSLGSSRHEEAQTNLPKNRMSLLTSAATTSTLAKQPAIKPKHRSHRTTAFFEMP